MSLFHCRGCVAREAEIERVSALLEAAIRRADGQASELLQMARETAGLRRIVPDQPQAPAPPALNPAIELFLDAKFVYGTTLWRQQRREAEKLVLAGLDAERITNTLAAGQQVEF